MSKPRKKSKGIFRGILRVFLFAVISLVIGCNLYTWNAKRVVGNALPMPLGYGVAVVLSGSMEPVLYIDDLVVIKATQDIDRGDIVIYQSGSSLVIHRVLSIDGETVVTKGDANNTEDDPINISDVKGKLVHTVRGAGTVTKVMRSPFVIVLILLLAIVLIELGYSKEKKEDNDDLDTLREEIRKLREEAVTDGAAVPAKAVTDQKPQLDTSDCDIFIDDIKNDIERLESELHDDKGGDSNGEQN